MHGDMGIWDHGAPGKMAPSQDDDMIEIEIGIVRPQLSLRVPASQDSLPVVRQAMRSLGETVEADLEALEDAELAVTEALANAVEHAYAGGDGEVRVTLDPRDRELVVEVSDDGPGMPEGVRRRHEGRGFGLSMIEGIARELEIEDGGGTRVRMTFEMGEADSSTVDGAAPGVEPAERLMRRLVAIVAAQLDMPSDRVVEALLVAELVARNALRYLSGDTAEVTIAQVEEGFELRVGPLEANGARAVVADTEVPVVGSVVERLVDKVAVEGRDGGLEDLILQMAARA